MNTTKEYIVTENPNWYGDNGHYMVYKRSNFDWIPYCCTYDDYGQRNCSDFCHGEEDENGNPIDGDHYEVYAYNYWDGSNWKTVVIGDKSEGFEEEEVDEELANAILAEMPEYPCIDGEYETVETESYTYFFDRYANASICSVE